MPKIYEYLGILIFFYSNEHEPIHVHAKRGENEIRAEFTIVDGKIEKIILKQVKGRMPLSKSDIQNFRDFLEVYGDNIVEKWIQYFVLHKEIPFERVTKRLK
ncbi:protein of unknown function [Tangfeifania diversioriginum]|uniref:DUF4160 domain-containing protein n=1 Tax=Tangfeifania diversioriginum TaxID=1168035 RepID=A0A1M6B3P1_9BACT|nr:DUF4160 domain-containing protein [Tangfeifania diversioriginum]SHI43316.1 protein of unknown function [Tangfeifania diversioriginum]